MSNLINMLSYNLLLIILFIFSEYKKNKEIKSLNNKLETFKKEKFSESISSSNIDMVSLKNLSNLANNIISNNGKTLNLNFSGIHILPFRGMVSPFNIEYTDVELKRLANSFWYPCDGKDNRPNLINRFIYGGQNVGNTGGEETVKLTVDQLPSHTHKQHYAGGAKTSGLSGAGVHGKWRDGYIGVNTTETGGGQHHNNMPPYMVMAYFIYLPPL